MAFVLFNLMEKFISFSFFLHFSFLFCLSFPFSFCWAVFWLYALAIETVLISPLVFSNSALFQQLRPSLLQFFSLPRFPSTLSPGSWNAPRVHLAAFSPPCRSCLGHQIHPAECKNLAERFKNSFSIKCHGCSLCFNGGLTLVTS